MRYTELEHLSNSELKRLCGVSRATFTQMGEVLRPCLERRGQRGGQAKLSVEDQLLVALEYWREYRRQTVHSDHSPTMPESEIQHHTLGKRTTIAERDARIDSFLPVAMLLDASALPHNRQHTGVFGGAMALVAAFSLTASAQHPSILISRPVAGGIYRSTRQLTLP